MTGTSDGDRISALIDALRSALDTRNRDAFTTLLTEDVHWGGEHGGNQCTNRVEAGHHYAGLLAAGITLHITDVHGDNNSGPDTGDNNDDTNDGDTNDTVTASLQVTRSDPADYPEAVTVRLTVRDGLIADIRELDPPPTIELLHIADCPNHESFLPHLRQLLDDHHIDAPITLIRVDDDDDARTRRFLGSPTVRVNGLDVEPAALDRDSYALQCRRYATPDGLTGTPLDRWIVDALIDNPDLLTAIEAIHTGNLPALRQVLTKHPALATNRSVRHGGRTLLHIATDWPGHFPNISASIGALVDHGADPNTPGVGAHAESPLHWAASSGDLDALDALLDAGADIEAGGAVVGSGTALADATAFGQWAAARRLVERGARSTLFDAAALGLVDQTRAQLDADHPAADAITSSFWGACHGGQLATARILLDRGADINWVGYDGLTPLGAARRADAAQLEIWLEDRGASAGPTDLSSPSSDPC